MLRRLQQFIRGLFNYSDKIISLDLLFAIFILLQNNLIPNIILHGDPLSLIMFKDPIFFVLDIIPVAYNLVDEFHSLLIFLSFILDLQYILLFNLKFIFSHLKKTSYVIFVHSSLFFSCCFSYASLNASLANSIYIL